MERVNTRSGMATFALISIIVCVAFIGQGYPESTGSDKGNQRDALLKDLISKLSKVNTIGRLNRDLDPNRERPLPSWMRNLMGSLKTLFPSKNLPSLNKPIDRHRLSGFLYNISLYLQEMGAELEEAPREVDEEQLWEKVLHFFLQSEGSAALNQWNGRVPPRPSISIQDWFLSLRGSQHWDWFLGLLQSVITLSERLPQKSLWTFLYQNWRTVSAVLETVLQGLVSGTYGQASAGLQGFICALKGRSDCEFNVSWLQELLQFLETRNWKPVVSLHPARETTGDIKGSTGRFRPFSLPPEAMRPEMLVANTSVDNGMTIEEEANLMQSFLLQVLSRSGGPDRSGNLAKTNLALVKSLDGFRRGLLHRVGSSVYSSLREKVSRVTMVFLDDVSTLVDLKEQHTQGKCSVGDLRHLILWGIRHNVMWNTQALGIDSQVLPDSLPLLSCPSSTREKQRSTQNQAEPSSQSASSTQTKRSHKLPAVPHTRFRDGDAKQAEIDFITTAEILEAACNESIPGLTGVSNFTVFLYCKLFEGENGSVNPDLAHMGLDLNVACTDAAWYLSAAEEDFFWVHVCSEFFAHEFNNTVCANSSFWLQRAHQALLSNEYPFFNQSSIYDLCVQLSSETTVDLGVSGTCLDLLGGQSLNADAFRHCFLPNNSVLISSLCSKEILDSQHPQGSWAAAYCSKIHNLSHADPVPETCRYSTWTVHQFTNSSLLERCGQTHALREFICLNASLYHQLLALKPQLVDFCSDFHAERESKKCFLQRLFDMLPARYNFDTSQLCADPGPLITGILHKLSVCEMEGGEREGLLVVLGYVLRVLDFMVGLSSGLDEGEREARQGLGQAILLSSLVDNSSWGALRPEASTSVLHTIGVFLRREQNATLKEDLLSCFSPILWDLIQQNDNSSALQVLLQEYLQMPRDSIRTLVMSAEKDAVKRFISHMHQSWDQLQVETSQASQQELQAMETMTAAFIHKFPRVTPELFVDLSQFIPYMSVSDIMSFPASLIVNDSVLTAIRDHSLGMRLPQKKAFMKRLLQSQAVGDVPNWPPYFLSSILPLLPYLPVNHFQQLTSQQLSPLVELLGNSSLDGVRGRHVLRTLFTKKKNLTGDDIARLGVLACYLDPAELGAYLQDSEVSFSLCQQLSECMSKGLVSASGRLSSWLVPAVQTLNLSSGASPQLSALGGLLPHLGAPMLLSLPTQQLLDILSKPGLLKYTLAQSFQILSKISEEVNLTAEQLCSLKPLHSGISTAVLESLQWSEISDSALCPCWEKLLTDLNPGQRAMIYNEMRMGLHGDLSNITQTTQCLLPFMPLRQLIQTVSGESVWRGINTFRDVHWSTQQAQFLFGKINGFKSVTIKSLRNLGRIAGGLSCGLLRLRNNDTDFSELLRFVSELPGGVRPALRKCIVEELRKEPTLQLNNLSSAFAVTLPVTMMEDLSNATVRDILDYIQSNFIEFLKLPRYKQTYLAERTITEQGSPMGDGQIDGPLLDILGPLLPFLDRDSLASVNREALVLRLEEMRSFCFPKEALRDISSVLTKKDLFGDPSKWEVGDVEHLGRLMFALSTKQINAIPKPVLSKDIVEQILVGQKRWKDSDIGKICVGLCVDHQDYTRQTQSLIQWIVKARSRRAKVPVPDCADVRGTFPSAWTSIQLRRMSAQELLECVEVFGQDSSLSSAQRRSLWVKLRQFFSPTRELRADQILALGSLVTEMGDRELQDAGLTDMSVLAHLGTLTDWNPRKMRVLIVNVLRKRGITVEQLTDVDLATFSHLICGLYPSEIKRLNPYNLSVAVTFLREMSLPCTEEQMEALTSCLSRPEAFGPVSVWGPEIFTEIGTLAAGLPDIVLSALLQEQMEGITPGALALMSPPKMAVVWSAGQLSWLSVEQAWAVTEEQWAELDAEQRHALMLARYEGDVLLGLRGRNRAPPSLNTITASLRLLVLCLLLQKLM